MALASKGSRRKAPRFFARPETEVLTRGFDPRLSVGSARPAVFRSSTYVFSSPEAAERAFAIALGKQTPEDGEDVELIYSRLSHPNAEILEDQVVPLEQGATCAAVFNSGMAAISTLALAVCHPGSSLVYTVPIYGGTHLLLYELLAPLGITPVPVAAGDTEGLARAIAEAENPELVLIETPANPTLRMTDIEAAVAAARSLARPPLVVVDNTFLGPVFQHPLRLGADACVYSATKYLAGFSDMLGGVVTSSDPELVQLLRALRATLGNILQPDESWLLDSRLATVRLRMNKQSKNAARIVDAITEPSERSSASTIPPLFVDPEQQPHLRGAVRLPGRDLLARAPKGGKARGLRVPAPAAHHEERGEPRRHGIPGLPPGHDDPLRDERRTAGSRARA